jgi:predicted HicB family RNase H-like nuclease
MTEFNPNRYTITVKLVTLEEGEYFEAVVAELPDIVEYGENLDQAYSLAVDSIETLREAALEQGRPFPDPIPSKALNEFSGRVTLRMSKSLHARVSMLADQEVVSLNSWIVEAISARAGAGFSASEHDSANQFSTFVQCSPMPYSTTEHQIAACSTSERDIVEIFSILTNNNYNSSETYRIMSGTNQLVLLQ